MAAKDILGKKGEDIAANHLAAAGYRIVERNWRCSQGELDIVAQRDDETVFVEVKTRSSLAFGHPFDAITPAKLARLRRLAGAWCMSTGPVSSQIRIDIVSVLYAGIDAPVIEHIEGVV
jgi:putative endonuclease